MMRVGNFLSGLVVATALSVGAAVAGAAAPAVGTPAASTRLDAVFKSLQEKTQGEPISVRWTPLLLGAAGLGLMIFTIKHWNRRQSQAPTKALHNHRKLLREAARAAGVSQSQLKAIAPLAQAQGLSSPLVAIICPSAIKKLAANVKTPEQQDALRAMAKGLLKREKGAA